MADGPLAAPADCVEHDTPVVCPGCGETIPLRREMTGLLTSKRVARTYGPDDVCAVCWFCQDYYELGGR